MNSKTHRQNHDFQIAYFLAGKCHTPDGAYAVLCDLKEEREAAIAHYHVSTKRAAAKELRAKTALLSDDPALRLEAEADLEELENSQRVGKVLFDAALAELSFITTCIEKVQPLRRFKHLPDAQAHEAAQSDEWRRDLIAGAENQLLCHGTIAADHLATMRAHPEFSQSIWPEVQRITAAVKTPEGQQQLLGEPSGLQLLAPPQQD